MTNGAGKRHPQANSGGFKIVNGRAARPFFTAPITLEKLGSILAGIPAPPAAEMRMLILGTAA